MAIGLYRVTKLNFLSIMRKLILSVAVATVALMVACTGKQQADKEDGGIMAKIENCTNTDSLKAYVDQAKAYAQTLVSEGKIEQAKEFLAKIEPVVKQKAPALATMLTSAESALDKVESAVGETADSTKQAVTDSVGNKIDAAKQTISNKASATVDKATDAVENAAGKASDAVGKAADKTADAVNKATDAVKDKLKAD